MRAILLLLLMAVPAAAFDGPKVAAVYNDVRPACRQGEFDGKPISAAQTDKFCVILDALGDQLKSNGWCWDKSEVEWTVCEQKAGE